MSTECETVTDENTVLPTETQVEAPKEETKSVSKTEFDKVMADMHKYKKALREIEAGKKQQELQTLKEKQEWQKIAEMKERMERLEAAIMNNSGTTVRDSISEMPKADADALNERETLAAQYEAKFGQRPHHRMGLDRIKEELSTGVRDG